MVAGCISDGVPPPKKIVETVRPGTRAAVAAISAAKARAKRASSMRLAPDMAVEVAIGTFRQAERPVDVDAEGLFTDRSRHASASLRKARARCDRPFAARRQAVFFVARHFAEGARCGRRAGTSDRSQSPCRRAAARPACRRRGPRIPRHGRPARRRRAPRRNAPCGVPASSRRARAAFLRSSPWRGGNSLSGPAQRAE